MQDTFQAVLEDVFRAVFIRAPAVLRTGNGVEELAHYTLTEQEKVRTAENVFNLYKLMLISQLPWRPFGELGEVLLTGDNPKRSPCTLHAAHVGLPYSPAHACCSGRPREGGGGSQVRGTACHSIPPGAHLRPSMVRPLTEVSRCKYCYAFVFPRSWSSVLILTHPTPLTKALLWLVCPKFHPMAGISSPVCRTSRQSFVPKLSALPISIPFDLDSRCISIALFDAYSQWLLLLRFTPLP
eukprot:1039428-Pelagomonas_calceolata.AAC.2